jgi:hypothetical protein
VHDEHVIHLYNNQGVFVANQRVGLIFHNQNVGFTDLTPGTSYGVSVEGKTSRERNVEE